MSSKIPATESLRSVAIEDVAAQWLARRQGGLSPIEDAQFAAWLAADARHRDTWAELEAAWATLSFPGQIGRAEEAKKRLATRAARRGRRRLAAAGVAMLLVIAVVLGVGM